MSKIPDNRPASRFLPLCKKKGRKLLRPRKVPLSEARILAWKNGKGTTSEIALFPEDSDFTKGTFFWRLSSAEIREPGPFSLFPGYDRALAVIEGGPLVVSDAAGGSMQIQEGEIFWFKGEMELKSLSQNLTRDLNLIVRRDFFDADVQVSREGKPSGRTPFTGNRAREVTLLLFVLSGQVRLTTNSPGVMELNPNDTAILGPAETEVPFELEALPGSSWIRIELRPKDGSLHEQDVSRQRR